MFFNIKRTNILSFLILAVTFVCTGNGNRLVAVTDEVEEEAVYDRKEYHDLNTNGNDFGYDANGNLIYDLDRDIVTIRYNLLNLPDTVQFRDGRQILNKYAADGTRLASTYYSPLHVTFEPLSIGETVNCGYYPPYLLDRVRTWFVGNKEYGLMEPTDYDYLELKRIYTPEGYVDKHDNYHYYRRDHLGNVREVWKATDAGPLTVLRTRYYPSGLPWEYQAGDSVSLQPYKFNGCEFIETHGYDVTDLGNRGVYHAINRFTSMDRFAEKYPWQSPYVHAGNNPVNFVDVGGDGVNISGPEQQTAFQETQISVSGELELTLQNTGAIIATQITTGTLSANAQQLMDAINSETITVNIVTTNGYTDENGNLIIGGSFGGNTVTQMANDNMVIATQTINPQVLRTMSNAHGTPGKDVLHEITEAYQGALISQQSGVSSPPANQPSSVYPQAHNSATPQSGTVTQTVYGAYGMPMPAMPSGNYPYPNQIQRVEWSVMDTSNQRIIIQSLP